MPRVKRKNPKRNFAAAFCDEVSPKSKIQKLSKCINRSQETSLQVRISTSEYPYNLGSFIVSEPDLSSCMNSEYIWLKFKPDTNNCSLHWKEIGENGEIQEKSCFAVCTIPYDILNCLSVMKIFYFITNSCISHSGNLVILIYIDSSTFISLKFASEPYFNHHKRKMYKILQFFLKIEFEEYEDCYVCDEEQVEKVYNSIYNCYHAQVSTVSVSHDYLIPNLRMYQSQAVQWMLKQEADNSHTETDLHMLYTSLTLPDGSEIYFHKYGGYFVNRKYSPGKLCKGGILADEMGLGKTLEVLACILLNPRSDTKKQCSELPSSSKDISDEASVVINQDSIKEEKQTLLLLKDAQENWFEKIYEHEWPLEESDNFKCVCGLRNYFI